MFPDLVTDVSLCHTTFITALATFNRPDLFFCLSVYMHTSSSAQQHMHMLNKDTGITQSNASLMVTNSWIPGLKTSGKKIDEGY